MASSGIPFLIGTGLTLFALGLMGVLIRRNLLVVLMALELMLNGANVILLGGSRIHGNIEGHILALFVIVLAAAEVGIGLGIILLLYNRSSTLDLSRFRQMKF
jgi:NADH-quinone oxidoreductase subunit K